MELRIFFQMPSTSGCSLSAHFSRNTSSCCSSFALEPLLGRSTAQPFQAFIPLPSRQPGQGPHSKRGSNRQNWTCIWYVGCQLHFLLAKYSGFFGASELQSFSSFSSWVAPTYQTDENVVNGTSNSGAPEASGGTSNVFTVPKSPLEASPRKVQRTWATGKLFGEKNYQLPFFLRCFRDFGLMDTYEWLR